MKALSVENIKSNTANMRGSTRSPGRIRSARNAFRHGLSVPVYSDHILAEKVKALAREIAGQGANATTLQLAMRVAEAQVDLRRVRDARHQILSRAMSDPYYDARAKMREKVAVIRDLLRPNAPEVSVAALSDYLTTVPQGPQKLALILAQEVEQLSSLDRYERRAMSRRKFAICAFDEAKNQ